MVKVSDICRLAIAVIGIAVLLPSQMCRAKAATRMEVASDGTGAYKTLQEAIATVPDNSDKRTVIHIKAGTYTGPFTIRASKKNITLEGDGEASTVLTYAFTVNEADPLVAVPSERGIGMFVQADGLIARNLTIENASGDHGQALALRLDGDREIVENCRIVGWQDTLMMNSGRSYFKDDYISGRVDFIYGSGAAVFTHCEIHSRYGGHITAANTPQDKPFGFVFTNCKLTGDSIPWVAPGASPPAPKTAMADLGRPWRSYASVTYLNCAMGSHIKPEGWNNWRNPENEKTARFAEFGSTGPGGDMSKRYAWAMQLTKDEADKITVDAVLGGSDHWNPEK